MELEFDSTRPIYLQIIDEVKRAVVRNILTPGEKLPSQRELALNARVNPNTVQRAYREMETMGLVETKRGEGTFISQDEGFLASLRSEMAHAAVQDFVRQTMALGLNESEVIQLVSEFFREAGVKGGSDHD
ncbi:MAG: GntR family transcriptional regulator [Firmicutes bacterium]|nr:GntR family transcriptional regulator [Bacillota bacterium]